MPKDVKALDLEYQQFVRAERIKFRADNRVRSSNVWETMYEHERDEVRGIIKKWENHITPLSEKWWKERGYGVIWPESSEDPMRVYELDSNT